MRTEWVKQKGRGRVTLFFNGWGMDARVISHLKTEDDLVVFYDYRHLETVPTDWSVYREVKVVAWSMGVWAAANTLPDWGIAPQTLIAFNGTECPVDNQYGIPVVSYRLTERGMNAEGREKFFARLFTEPSEREAFASRRPLRELPEQTEELSCIRKLSTEHKKCLKWNKVFISENDLIFPAHNQLTWWKDRAPVCLLSGGHYPFFRFHSWEEIA